MRIVDLGEFYSERGGGVRSYLGGWLKVGAALGHEVVVLAPGPRDSDEAVEGGRVIRYRAPKMPYDGTYHLPFRVDLMRSWLTKLRPDVLQLSSPYLPWVTARNIQAPLKTYIYHSDPIGAYVRPASSYVPKRVGEALQGAAWAWMKAVCKSCDITVVAGDWQRQELERRGIDNAAAIPFGIAHRDFGPQHRSASLRETLLGERADSSALLVVAGRLAVEKRQAEVVRAVARLAQHRDLFLLILGDGPERARLGALCQERLPGRHALWKFTQDRAQYAQVLASADALVHASRCETYGFVLVEALASGTPLVVPDAGAAPHLGPEGSVVYPLGASSEEVARCIDQALEAGAPLREAATRAAATHPTTEQHFEQLFALYQSRLDRASAS